MLQFLKDLIFNPDKIINSDELQREAQSDQMGLTRNHLIPSHSHYLNEEVDHVCVIALHRMHERTLATFNVLIIKKMPWEKSVEAYMVNVTFVI